MEEKKWNLESITGAVVVIGAMVGLLYGLIHLNVLIDFANYLSESLF